MSQDTARKLKKGEKLLAEGSPGNVLFFIQSGRVKVSLERGGKAIEVAVLGPQQVIGDQWLFSQTSKSLFNYEALQECHILEVPVDLIKAHLEKSNAALKLIVKSMADELKGARQAQRSKVLEGDFSPMPMNQMAKSLSLIHLAARHLGRPAEGRTAEEGAAEEGAAPGQEIDWNLFRQFLQRFFMEPTSRLKQWMLLFKKKGLAHFEIKTDEEGEEDLGKIILTDLQRLEDFAEFYQHYYFKSPAHELIQFEEAPFKAAKILVELGDGVPVDHKKATPLEMSQINEAYKKAYGTEFKTSLFDHLERKGLFVKRKSFDDGRLIVSFDREEYSKIVGFWELLREVNQWNEKGLVDMNEKVEAPQSSKLLCSSCQSELNEEHKFCPQCGMKLAA